MSQSSNFILSTDNLRKKLVSEKNDTKKQNKTAQKYLLQ